MARAQEKSLQWSPSGKKRSWLASLLGASILSSCFLLNQAQSGSPKEVPVTWVPPNPIQGQNVTLTPGGGLENVVSCNWYRGRTSDLAKRIFAYYLPPNTLGQVNGSAHTGRETGGPDCSLHIRNLTSADSGNYTVIKDRSAPTIGYATIEVSVPSRLPEDKTSVSSIWVIVSMAVILALIGTLLLFFLRAHRRRERTSTQTITAPTLYENLPPPGQIKPGNASADNNIYQLGKSQKKQWENTERMQMEDNLNEAGHGHNKSLCLEAPVKKTLQPESQAVYEELTR